MREEKKKSKTKNVKKAVIQGVFLQLGIYIIVILLLAFAISKEVLQETNSPILIYLTTAIATWCGGKYVTKSLGTKTHFYAIIPALCFCLISAITAMWVHDGEISIEKTIMFMAVTLIGGAFSMLIPKHKKRRGKRLLK